MVFIIVFVVALAIGVPVFSVLGLATVIPTQLYPVIPQNLIPQAMFNGLNSFPLIAIAGFIYAGLLMQKARITDGILDLAYETVGRFHGGYAIMCILASTFFAALTGAGPACTAAIGTITIPLMLKAGYDRGFTSGVAAAGGTLGVMIPPSNPMIIYGVAAKESVSDLFLAGILPGLLTAVLLIVACIIICKRRGYEAVGEPFSKTRLLKTLWSAKFGIFAPVLILGSIYGGYATPTESSILACVYTIIVGFCTKKLTLKDTIGCLKTTIIMCGSMVIILGVSTAFGRILTIWGVPQTVAGGLSDVTTNPYMIQLLIFAVMVFIGMWLDPIAAIIIVVPVFMPLIEMLEISKIAFGILLVLTTQIAFITPPVATNLYVVSNLTKAPLTEVGWNVIPFILCLVIVALVVIFFPGITTFLPNLFGG